MKKNSHIHIVIETSFKEALKREAKSQNMYFSEFCRNKLREDLNLLRIEKILIEIKNGLNEMH
jgi:hypothetical protein